MYFLIRPLIVTIIWLLLGNVSSHSVQSVLSIAPKDIPIRRSLASTYLLQYSFKSNVDCDLSSRTASITVLSLPTNYCGQVGEEVANHEGVTPVSEWQKLVVSNESLDGTSIVYGTVRYSDKDCTVRKETESKFSGGAVVDRCMSNGVDSQYTTISTGIPVLPSGFASEVLYLNTDTCASGVPSGILAARAMKNTEHCLTCDTSGNAYFGSCTGTGTCYSTYEACRTSQKSLMLDYIGQKFAQCTLSDDDEYKLGCLVESPSSRSPPLTEPLPVPFDRVSFVIEFVFQDGECDWNNPAYGRIGVLNACAVAADLHSEEEAKALVDPHGSLVYVMATAKHYNGRVTSISYDYYSDSQCTSLHELNDQVRRMDGPFAEGCRAIHDDENEFRSQYRSTGMGIEGLPVGSVFFQGVYKDAESCRRQDFLGMISARTVPLQSCDATITPGLYTKLTCEGGEVFRESYSSSDCTGAIIISGFISDPENCMQSDSVWDVEYGPMNFGCTHTAVTPRNKPTSSPSVDRPSYPSGSSQSYSYSFSTQSYSYPKGVVPTPPPVGQISFPSSSPIAFSTFSPSIVLHTDTSSPSVVPLLTVSSYPSCTPSLLPTVFPSIITTTSPSIVPSLTVSSTPSYIPSLLPTVFPSIITTTTSPTTTMVAFGQPAPVIVSISVVHTLVGVNAAQFLSDPSAQLAFSTAVCKYVSTDEITFLPSDIVINGAVRRRLLENLLGPGGVISSSATVSYTISKSFEVSSSSSLVALVDYSSLTYAVSNFTTMITTSPTIFDTLLQTTSKSMGTNLFSSVASAGIEAGEAVLITYPPSQSPSMLPTTMHQETSNASRGDNILLIVGLVVGLGVLLPLILWCLIFKMKQVIQDKDINKLGQCDV